jgi:hypothetical protein
MYNISNGDSGSIQNKFILNDPAIKKAVLKKAIEESKSRVRISDVEMHNLLQYAEDIKCNK